MGDPARKLDRERAADVEAAFAAAPEEMVAEIIDGELSLLPRPARRHTRTAYLLGIELGTLFDLGRGGPGGWLILPEPELHLGPAPDKLVPDLAGWRRERLSEAEGDLDGPYYFSVAPDWVCEVVSPSTERMDRGRKRDIYARERIPFLWLLNPVARVLEVHRLDDADYRVVHTFTGDAVVRAEPFDAVELDLGAIWG